MRHYPAASGPVRIVTVTVSIAVIAGIVYFGLRYFKEWHEREVREAVHREEVKFAGERAELEQQLLTLTENLAKLEPRELPGERMDEVFGAAVSEEPDCTVLEERIRSFFDYLDGKNELGIPDSRAVFTGIVADLCGNPPIVVSETRDMISLMRNQAHFFRILDPVRLELLKGITEEERDVLEPVLDLFFRYYVSADCCRGDSCIPLETAYDYASFFLDTLSGQSYMMRRESTLRGLVRYYAVRILDLANDKGMNRYGMDIREHVAMAIDDIRNLDHLLLKDRYLAELELLAAEYTPTPPRLPPVEEAPAAGPAPVNSPG